MRSPGRWRRGRKRAVGRHRGGEGPTIFLNNCPHISVVPTTLDAYTNPAPSAATCQRRLRSKIATRVGSGMGIDEVFIGRQVECDKLSATSNLGIVVECRTY